MTRGKRIISKIKPIDRDKRIKKALQLLNPPAFSREKCITDLGMAVNFMEQEERLLAQSHNTRSKLARQKYKRYYRALRRAQAAFNNLNNDAKQELQSVRSWFGLDDQRDDLNFQRDADAVEMLLKLREWPRDLGWQAAVWANGLCSQYGHKPKLTRGSIWPRLAAILRGDPTADLLRHCARVDRALVATQD
jgi:hypothetical protein